MSKKDLGIVISIDGGAGVGKSSTSKGVAAKLGFAYLDTGAMYRAFTYFLMQQNKLENYAAELETLFEEFVEAFFISLDPDGISFELGDLDITQIIRSEEVTSNVSSVSSNPEFRKYMVNLQKDIIAESKELDPGIVVEGRDIATVVAPNADLKILLYADTASKALRRGGEVKATSAEEIAEVHNKILKRDEIDAKTTDFSKEQADDVQLLDNSNLSLQQTVDLIIGLTQNLKLSKDADAQMVEDLPDGVDESEIEQFENLFSMQLNLPKIAIIGRANVGKSTFINRILGHRSAIVEDTPGVTRDRISYRAAWQGKDFELIDTGGLEELLVSDEIKSSSDLIQQYINEQVRVAISESDCVVFIADATNGLQAQDSEIAKIVRKAEKPSLLLINKADDKNLELNSSEFWKLGLGEPIAVSALHGRGIGDALDLMLGIIPEQIDSSKSVGYRKVALIGRPNVGKSSLLNKLSKRNRSIVSDIAGTTRDAVDELIEKDGKNWLFVDTAGIKRRARRENGADYFSFLRSNMAIENSEVTILLIDASQEISEQDIKLANEAEKMGKAIVIALNKWDLVDEDRQQYINRILEEDFAHISWAPRVNISALTGRATDKLFKAMEKSLEAWETRIPTGVFNSFLNELQMAHPHPLRGGKQPRILYGTQSSIRPPHFVLFTSGFLETNYRRYIERRLRETFNFEGSPIQISMRIREKRKDRVHK